MPEIPTESFTVVQPKAAEDNRLQLTQPDALNRCDEVCATRPLPRLLIPFGILLAVLVGYNLLIHQTAKSTYRHRLLTSLSEIPLDTDFLFLGNSLVEAGCDTSAFRNSWPIFQSAPKPVNIALGATSPVEHYLILKHAFERPIHPKYLVYGFFDDQLNVTPHGDWADLVGNRGFSYYFPEEAAALYAPGSSLKKWQLRIVGHIPMLAERSSYWSKVELLRRDIEDIGMPRHQTTRYGRVQDFAALEAADLPSFNRRCEAILSQCADFSPAIHKIIELSQEHEMKVIFLEMPMPSHHRELFYSSPKWIQMRACLRTLAQQNRAQYICASDWVADDTNFEDATHLNEHGAKEFSARLAETLSQPNYDARALGSLP